MCTDYGHCKNLFHINDSDKYDNAEGTGDDDECRSAIILLKLSIVPRTVPQCINCSRSALFFLYYFYFTLAYCIIAM